MSGQTLVRADIPLPGGGEAVYTASGLSYYRHADQLGSARLSTYAVDKWGRQSSPKTQGAGNDSLGKFLRKQLLGASRRQKLAAILLLIADVVYDFYSPRAVFFDVIVLVSIGAWYRRSRQGRRA